MVAVSEGFEWVEWGGWWGGLGGVCVGDLWWSVLVGSQGFRALSFFWGASRAVSASFILVLWWRFSVCDGDDLADGLGVVLEVWGEIWFRAGHGGGVGELGGGGGGGLPGSVVGGGASGKR